MYFQWKDFLFSAQNMFAKAFNFVAVLVRFSRMCRHWHHWGRWKALASRFACDIPVYIWWLSNIFSGLYRWFCVCISAQFELVLILNWFLWLFLLKCIALCSFWTTACSCCSTSPIRAVPCQAPFCEMTQLGYLPVSCIHFSGSVKSKGWRYCIWTKGRWKRLWKVQVSSVYFLWGKKAL